MSTGPLILGIESSCDETGVGIVRGNELLANEVASSVEEHVRFGGVVPEVASRAHLQALVPALRRACETADIDLSELDGIAVTAGPGLMGALVIGLSAAKALAVALDKGPQPAAAEAEATNRHLKFWKNDDSRSAIEYGWRCDEHKHTLSWPQSEATIASI